MQTISLTPAAVERLRGLLADEKEGTALRLFVSSGGCSGLQYGMALDDQVRPDDEVIEQDGLKVLVDELTKPYVAGSELDYIDSLMGAGFTVHNPNAVRSCGCGHSFDAGDDSGCASGCCGR